MSNVGFATLQIIPSAQGFGAALSKETTPAMATAGTEGGKKMGGGILSGVKGYVGPVAGAFAAVKAVDFLGDSIGEFREAETVARVLSQEIATTGASAWTSAGQMGDFATSLQNKIAVDDDAIKSNETLLLSFRNVTNQAGAGNDIFNQTTAAAYDMAQVMGTDAQSGIMMLGKALNDPIEGMSKLTRAGVTFTDAQKEQVKALVASGDTLGAQKVILQEVQKEFGGAAAAAVDPSDKLGVSVGNLKESIGGALVPAVNAVIGPLTSMAGFLGENIGWIGPLIGLVGGIVAAIKIWTVVQAILDAELWANPVGVVILAITALIAIIVIIATKTTWFQDLWHLAWGGIKDAASAVANWFSGPFVNFFVDAYNAVIGKIGGIVDFVRAIPGKIIDAFVGIGQKIGGAIGDGVKSIWNKTIGGFGFGPYDMGPVHIPSIRIPYLAKGGVVNGPTVAMIGEAGPEAVIPLQGNNRPKWLDNAGGGDRILNYYAAPGNSLDSEEDLFAAAGRTRMVW